MKKITNCLKKLYSFKFAILLTGTLFFANSSLLANTYTVTSTGDHPITGAGITVNPTTGVITGGTGNGLVTVRSAIAAANAQPGTHTINIPAGTFNLTIPGTGELIAPAVIGIGDLDVTRNSVTIHGAGMNSTIINQTSGIDRVFDVNVDFIANFIFTIDNLTISGGREQTGNGGGGMFTGSSNNLGTITITNVKFDNNQAFQAVGFLGSGFGGGGLQHQGGDLFLSGCIFNNNTTTKSGGAVSAFGFRNLPIAPPIVPSIISITNCTFTNNSAAGASGGGAIDVFAFNLGQPTVSISNCSFSSNVATASIGGAIANESTPMTVEKCTFLNNTAKQGGGIYVGGGPPSTVQFCRFIGNTATNVNGGNGVAVAGASVVLTANNNWWGVNTGPSAADAIAAGGATLNLTKWLQLKHTANPTSVVVSPPGSTTLTASFLTNNLNEAISTSNLTTIIGLPIIFNNAIQGSLSAAQTTIQSSGTATATYTVFATACPPSGSADAKVDNATATATITIIDNIPPTVSCPSNKTVSNDINLCGASVILDAVATDNCPGAFVNYKIGATPITSPHFFPVGTTTVIAQAQDASGNLSTSTCSFTVTVNDTQVPAINCTGNQTVNVGAGICTYTHSGITWNATGSDNCTTISFAYTLSGETSGTGTTLDGKTFNKGITTVKWTATDGSNNTSTCSFTVTVNDNQNPSISCTTDKIVNTDAGFCSYTQSGTAWDATGSDNCIVISFAYSLSGATSGTGTSLNNVAFSKGVTTVKWTATDGSSNTATCSFTVTVNDVQAPTISCPADKIVGNDANVCSASVTLDAIASDNCPGAIVIYKVNGSTITNPYIFPFGVTTVVVQAQDASGNLSTSTCSFTVTVNDVQVPAITLCPGSQIVNTDANQCYATLSVGNATATDNCGAPSVNGVRSDAQALNATYPKGITTIIWTATDASNNTSTCQQTITVNDVQVPIITSCSPDQTVNTDANQCHATVSVGTATASDNCPGVTVDGVRSDAQPLNATYPKGITTIKWTATDASNNTATCSQTITVNDNQPPSITCPATVTVTEDPAGSGTATVPLASLGSPTTSDNCPGETWQRSGVPAGNVYPIGNTILMYTATDASGNTATCQQTVTVNPACQITCPVVSPVSNDEGQCGAIVNYSASTTTGNCGTLTYSHPSGSFFPVGTTMVTVSSASTGQSCQFAVTVNDTEFPQITTCPGTQIVSTDNNVCSASVSFAAVASDNCATGFTVKYFIGAAEISSPHIFPKGATTVTVKATDAAGNQTTCTFDVTVNDTQIPTVTPPSNKTFFTGAGASACSKLVSLADFGVATHSDNCPGETVQIIGVPAGNIFPVGITTLTYRATDASGNTATAQQTITVIDNTPPVLSCPGNVTVNTGTGRTTCDKTASWTVPTPTDNCSIQSLTANKNPGDLFPVGTTTVKYTATDVNGNTATCSFSVTVIDNTGPAVSGCPSGITVQTGVGNTTCTQTATWTEPTAIDNCDGSVGYSFRSHAPGSTFNLGMTTVTYEFEDEEGNETVCSFIVTVQDNTKPVISGCPSGQTVVAPANSCSQTATWTEPTATDNCSGSIGYHSRSHAPGASFNVGNTTVMYVFRDGAGNESTCSFTITVTDVTPPAITGVSATPASLWPPNHKMKDVTINYTSTDLCGGAATCNLTVTSNQPIDGTSDGDTSPDWVIVDAHHVQLRAERANHSEGRVYTIKITCTDASGNTATSSVTVVVAHNITAPITGNSFKVGSTVNFAGEFWDKPGNKHTAQWVIDGSTIAKGIVTAEPTATKNGKVTGSYKFTAPGIYKLQMNVTDQNKNVSYANTNEDLEAIVVIYDQNGGFTYGGGWYSSPAGTLTSNAAATGKASYGFSMNYYKNATNPKGETQFEFKLGEFEYNALNFDYLVISNSFAQFKGTGKIIGGQSGINFIMSVVDGQLDGTGVDKVRLKIYNKNNGLVYYDNMPGASDAALPVQAVGTNSSIVIGGTNSNIITKSTTQEIIPEVIQEFNVRALPNPSKASFTINVTSSNLKDMVKLQVIDMYGRIVEVKTVMADQTIKLGEKYRPGTYVINLMQGDQRRQLKLIKLPD